MNITHRLSDVVAAYPDRTAVASGDGELTYAELADTVERYAVALREVGIDTGDRFNLLMVNSNRMLAILLAGWHLGAIPAPINYRLGDDAVRSIVAEADSAVVIVEGVLEHRAEAVSEVEGVSAIVSNGEDGDLDRRLPDEAAVPFTPRLDGEAALLLHTAGTTGRPKWSRLTHGNLAACRAVSTAAGVTGEFTDLHYFPLYHSGGIDLTLCRLLVGATTVIGSSWDPEDALSYIESYACDGVVLVPQMGYELVNAEALSEYDRSSLRYIWVGGDTVSEKLASSFQSLGVRSIQGYGLTETMAVVSVTSLGDDDAPLASTGKVIEDIARVQVVDPETGEAKDAGEIGEITIAGDKVFDGYYNRPELDDEVLTPDGWMHTEDLGMLDADGYLHITGRLDDMMIIGGENVYPTEIETALKGHAGVNQASVVAIEDERRGQLPVANVVLEENVALTEEELKQWFVDRYARFKCPRRIRFLDDLPRTALGKVDKVALEEREWAEREAEGAVDR